MNKVPALLVRTNKRPVLAVLHLGDDALHVVEVKVRGENLYALGVKRRVSYYWMIPPTTKTNLWKVMQEMWDIIVE